MKLENLNKELKNDQDKLNNLDKWLTKRKQIPLIIDQIKMRKTITHQKFKENYFIHLEFLTKKNLMRTPFVIA